MKICYFGTYRAEYSRNRIMINALISSDVEVLECHQLLWYGIEDRVRIVSGGWKNPKFWLRVIKVYIKLLIKYIRLDNYDLMIVGYPGQFDIFLARILTWINRKPLIWDILMSLNLISTERNLTKKSPVIISLIKFIEKNACRLPENLIIESKAYADWFHENYQVPLEKFFFIPLGADENIYRITKPYPKRSGIFKVLYYGSFIPNHGIEIMIQAARSLEEVNNILFIFIGEGPELKNIQLSSKDLSNVKFLGYLPTEKMIEEISSCDVCLGAFGHTLQSNMTIQNKIFESLAMGKPIITGHSPVMDETFINKMHLYLTDRTYESLANAILDLKSNAKLREELAENGYSFFQNNFSKEVIGKKLIKAINQVLIESK